MCISSLFYFIGCNMFAGFLLRIDTSGGSVITAHPLKKYGYVL